MSTLFSSGSIEDVSSKRAPDAATDASSERPQRDELANVPARVRFVERGRPAGAWRPAAVTLGAADICVSAVQKQSLLARILGRSERRVETSVPLGLVFAVARDAGGVVAVHHAVRVGSRWTTAVLEIDQQRGAGPEAGMLEYALRHAAGLPRAQHRRRVVAVLGAFSGRLPAAAEPDEDAAMHTWRTAVLPVIAAAGIGRVRVLRSQYARHAQLLLHHIHPRGARGAHDSDVDAHVETLRYHRPYAHASGRAPHDVRHARMHTGSVPRRAGKRPRTAIAVVGDDAFVDECVNGLMGRADWPTVRRQVALAAIPACRTDSARAASLFLGGDPPTPGGSLFLQGDPPTAGASLFLQGDPLTAGASLFPQGDPPNPVAQPENSQAPATARVDPVLVAVSIARGETRWSEAVVCQHGSRRFYGHGALRWVFGPGQQGAGVRTRTARPLPSAAQSPPVFGWRTAFRVLTRRSLRGRRASVAHGADDASPVAVSVVPVGEPSGRVLSRRPSLPGGTLPPPLLLPVSEGAPPSSASSLSSAPSSARAALFPAHDTLPEDAEFVPFGEEHGGHVRRRSTRATRSASASRAGVRSAPGDYVAIVVERSALSTSASPLLDVTTLQQPAAYGARVRLCAALLGRRSQAALVARPRGDSLLDEPPLDGEIGRFVSAVRTPAVRVHYPRAIGLDVSVHRDTLGHDVYVEAIADAMAVYTLCPSLQ